MTVFLGKQTVSDFDKFMKGFDEGEDLRQKHGIKIVNVFRGVENRNLVVILSESTPEALEKFMALPELQEAMKESGATSSLETLALERIQ